MRIAMTSLLVCLASTATAQIERQHDSHEHGRIDLQLAQADGQFEARLIAPGSDIVGFEHAPADARQQAVIDTALAVLGDAPSWLTFEPADACTVSEAIALPRGFDIDTADQAHVHDHGHDGHDGHGHDRDAVGAHGEFQVTVNGECSRTPTAMRLDLRQHFPGADRIHVEFLNDSHQGRLELQGGQGVAALTPP